jgi:hypothetical protein
MTNFLETTVSWFFPLFVTAIVLAVQWMFWMPSSESTPSEDASTSTTTTLRNELLDEDAIQTPNSNDDKSENQTSKVDNPPTPTLSNEANETLKNKETKEKDNTDDNNDESEENLFQMNDQWRCACEGGFLPPGLLKSFGGAEAMMRLGTGQCYHKQM